LKRCILPFVASFAIGAHAHPLDVAAYEAVKACIAAVPEISIDDCGDLAGRSPERTAARQAASRYFKARTAFIGTCNGRHPAQCMHEVIWHTEVGIKNALDPEPAQLPRSDTRR
jgi:hypothetical protein